MTRNALRKQGPLTRSVIAHLFISHTRYRNIRIPLAPAHSLGGAAVDGGVKVWNDPGGHAGIVQVQGLGPLLRLGLEELQEALKVHLLRIWGWWMGKVDCKGVGICGLLIEVCCHMESSGASSNPSRRKPCTSTARSIGSLAPN